MADQDPVARMLGAVQMAKHAAADALGDSAEDDVAGGPPWLYEERYNLADTVVDVALAALASDADGPIVVFPDGGVRRLGQARAPNDLPVWLGHEGWPECWGPTWAEEQGYEPLYRIVGEEGEA